MVAMVVIGVAAYANSVRIPFLWDDLPSIVHNETIRRFWAFPGALAPPLETPMAGRPVVNVSLAINYAIDGLRVNGYHWMNIGIHVACAMLVYLVAWRALASQRVDATLRDRAHTTAWLAAVLWMVHPLQTEAVDYVTQRTESMMGLFLLLTLYCSMRSMREPERGTWWPSGAVLCCVLGMACKASMAPAPVLVLLYDRAFESTSLTVALRRRPWLYMGLAASWIVLVALMWAAPRSTVGGSGAESWQIYGLNQLDLVARYLRLAVWPQGLVLDYGLPRALTLRDVWPEALVLLVLVTGVSRACLRRPAVGFAGIACILMLAPTSSVIPIITEVGAERRMYVPMMALVVLATAAGHLCVERLRQRFPAAAHQLAIGGVAIAAGLAVVLASLTVSRNALYRDPVALWQDTIRLRPHSRARLSLAAALMESGRATDAVAELRLALHDFPEAGYALGSLLYKDGRLDEAVDALNVFVTASERDRSRTEARSLLARIFTSRQEWDRAAAEYRAILEVSPLDRDAHEHLGDVLLSRDQWDDAVAEYDRAAAGSARADLEVKRGLAHKGANRLDAATVRFERALVLDPRTPQAHRNLAEIAWESGNREAAVRHAQAELTRNSSDASTHNFLGVVLASSGNVREGAEHFREALRIDPTNRRAAENLARAERDSPR